MIEIYTDGACKKGGDGGWGVAVYSDGVLVDTLCGGELDTTNNRMELKGFIAALQYAYDKDLPPSETTILSDSMYVVKGTTEWLRGWMAKGWKDVKNPDLWQRVASANFIWGKMCISHVKAHAGNEGNEKADSLANEGVKKIRAGEW